MSNDISPLQALAILHAASKKAPMPEIDHLTCKQCYDGLVKLFTPKGDAPAQVIESEAVVEKEA